MISFAFILIQKSNQVELIFWSKIKILCILLAEPILTNSNCANWVGKIL